MARFCLSDAGAIGPVQPVAQGVSTVLDGALRMIDAIGIPAGDRDGGTAR